MTYDKEFAEVVALIFAELELKHVTTKQAMQNTISAYVVFTSDDKGLKIPKLIKQLREKQQS